MKVVLVTGAGFGIGRAIALEFARAGWAVAATDRNEVGLDETRAGAEQIAARPCDVTDADGVDALVAWAAGLHGRLDCLVNNAADQTPGDLESTELAVWDRVMAVNLRAPFVLAKAALPHLIASRGSIVNLGSLVGDQPIPDRVAYCTSKAAVAGLTRSLATDLGRHGIRVNAIAPGHIMSAGEALWKERNDARTQRVFATTYPLERVGHAEEVARVALFLASDAASFVTGATVPVDGGMRVLCPETGAFRAAALD